MYNNDELAIICLDSIIELEYKHKTKILSLVKSPRELLNLKGEVISKIYDILGNAKGKSLCLCFEKEYSNQVIFELEKRNIVAVTYLSKNYPKSLNEIDFKPLIIYAKGNLGLLNKNKFAIVGSRKTLTYALKFCEDLSKNLSENGIVIVSGSAEGGDRSALIGSVESGNVISILAHGHDLVSPESNRQLIEKIANKGLVISEYPPKVPPRAWTYPIRNRLIAGLSEGVLIISGEMKSGAKYTGDFAIEFNKNLFALPYSIGIKSGELCNYYIKNGAYLCDNVKDVLDTFNLTYEQKPKIELFGNEKLVYEAILNGCDNANSLMIECNLKIFQLTSIISSLELKGLVVKLLGNKLKAVK